MAERVEIEIPGIGKVEAKNAASEKTLQEILKAMQGVQKNTGGGVGSDPKAGGGAGGAGGGGAGGGKGGSQSALNKAAQAAGASLSRMSAKVMPVVSGLGSLAEGLTQTISAFANVGDSVNNAADALSFIPVLGGMFKAVAGAATKANEAYLAAAKSGATFGGSVNQFAASASAAGMTMDKFGALVAKNGQGMLAFGSTTEGGAKRFAQVAKTLQSTNSGLYALGYSTEDINQGLASYGDLMRKQGLQGTKSNAELAKGAEKYMKELDAMAKITGEERSAKEAEMKKLAQDAQFQAAMAGKSEDVRMSFMKTVGSLPAPLQGFVKDFLATGTLTSEETQKIGAMMGGDVMNELQSMRNKMQSGTALTAQEQDRLAAIMKAAAEKQLKANGTALAASREMDGATNAMASALQLQTGAHKKTAEEQKKSAKEGDGFNKKMQEMQQQLAKFSNMFTMVLANSGILDVMMKTFTFLANLVTTFVVPAFQLLSGIISTVGNFLIGVFQPIFESVGSFIKDQLYPAFLDLAAFIIVDVIPPLQEIGRTIMEYVTPMLEWLGQVIEEYVTPVFTAISDFIQDNLQPIMLGLAVGIGTVVAAYLVKNAVIIAGTVAQAAYNLATLAGAAAMALLTSPIFLVIAGITAMVAIFKVLYDKGFTFSSALEELTDGFLRMLNKVTFGAAGITEEEHKARMEKRELERKVIADERNNSEDKKARAVEAAKLDNKIMGHKKSFAGGISKSAEKVEEANKTIDNNQNGEGLLKQFAAKEGSALIPKTEAAKGAEATKKEIETKGEEKKAAEEKAAKEAEDRKAAEEKAKEEKEKKPSTQESAETLLAQLNTNMSQLLKLTMEQKNIGEQQLSVTKGLSGNLFKA